MTKVKLCGLTRFCEIETVNKLKPEYIGFVFSQKSRRYVTEEKAAELKAMLDSTIKAVGVFVNEEPEAVARLLNSGVIDMAQIHGTEGEDYVKGLRALTDKPIIKAFRIGKEEDIRLAEKSGADYVLLDSGAGTGRVFDWKLIRNMERPYLLAGGLETGNVETAVKRLKPYAVDVSSGIETGGVKDRIKMAAFVAAVRCAERMDI